MRNLSISHPLCSPIGNVARTVRCLALALIALAILPAAQARTTLRIHTTANPPVVGQSTDVFLQVDPLAADARITILVLEPGSRDWTILTRDAPRSGGIPRVSWRPASEGVHTLRVDYAVPGRREIRKTSRVRVERDAVRLTITGGVPALGSSVMLNADYGSRSQRGLDFAVKYDDEGRWVPINGGRSGNSIRWFPHRDGRAELRVRASDSSGRVTEGFTRVLVRPEPEPVRMTGRPPLSSEFPPFPHLIRIDETSAYAGQPRQLTVDLGGEPRRDRRIRIRYRHLERDRAWKVHRENSDRLAVEWTPWHPGDYLVEAEVTESDGRLVRREEIRFTALDPRR